jgi:clan AA aspartic protease
MIPGVVNARLEVTTRLVIQDASGQAHDVETMIDTGYSGSLTLPPAQVATLGLSWLCQQRAVLADGSIQVLEVYTATIIWDGQPRIVEVDALDGNPLVGMTILEGHELRIKVVSGGMVTIEALP